MPTSLAAAVGIAVLPHVALTFSTTSSHHIPLQEHKKQSERRIQPLSLITPLRLAISRATSEDAWIPVRMKCSPHFVPWIRLMNCKEKFMDWVDTEGERRGDAYAECSANAPRGDTRGKSTCSSYLFYKIYDEHVDFLEPLKHCLKNVEMQEELE